MTKNKRSEHVEFKTFLSKNGWWRTEANGAGSDFEKGYLLKNLFICILFASLPVNLGIAANTRLAGNGIGPFVVGKPPLKPAKSSLVFRKWESDENGVTYEFIRIKLNRTAVDAEVYDGRVWRISINERGISTVDGISVGNDAGQVLRENEFVNPEIGPGPTVVLISNNPCGLSYITDAKMPSDLETPLNRETAVPILKFAKIRKIVASGCG